MKQYIFSIIASVFFTMGLILMLLYDKDPSKFSTFFVYIGAIVGNAQAAFLVYNSEDKKIMTKPTIKELLMALPNKDRIGIYNALKDALANVNAYGDADGSVLNQYEAIINEERNTS